MAKVTTWAGVRARAKINGVVLGYASSVSGGEQIDYEPVDVLDLLEVKEFVPVAYRATLNATAFRIIGNSLKAQGIFPVEEQILTSGDLTLTLEDRVTGNTVAQFEECKCSEHSFDVTARGIVAENLSFVCIRLRDEFERPIGG